MGAVITILVGEMFKAARAMLIRGKSELLLGMYIVKKLDSEVNVGSDQFNVGQSE